MSKWTAGKWICAPAGRTMREDYSQPFAIAESGAANLIAGVFVDVRGGRDVAAANAVLIAAAPEMAEWLQAFGDFQDGRAHEHPSMETLRALLKRIRGEQ